MSGYTPPPEVDGVMDVLQGGCALLVLGLTVAGLVVLVLSISGVVR